MKIILEMTPDVAQTLADLTQCVAGDLSTSYRLHIELIGEALEGAGVVGESSFKKNRFGSESLTALPMPQPPPAGVSARVAE